MGKETWIHSMYTHDIYAINAPVVIFALVSVKKIGK